MHFFSLKVSTVKGDVPPLLADYILGVVLDLAWVDHRQENLSTGNWIVIEKNSMAKKAVLSYLRVEHPC